MRVNRTLKNIETIKKIGIYCWSIIGLLILTALFFYVIYRIRIAIIPLIVAAGIAYLLSPLVILLEKKMKRVFAVTIAYIIFTGFFFTLFFFMVPLVVDQFKLFVSKLPLYIKNLTEYINLVIEKNIIVSNIEGVIGKEFAPLDSNAISQYFINLLSTRNINFLQGVTAFTRSIINIVVIFIFGPLLGIYILKDSGKLRNVFIKVLSAKYKDQANNLLDRINNVGGRYIRAQILISIIVGILCSLILFLLKVDFPVLLGFIAGILNLVPFLGPILGAIPAALTAFFISPLKALLVILLFVAVQQVDNYVISPNIMKYQVGVHPAIVIFVLITGGALFGPLGLLLAVPTIAVIQAIMKYYLLERKKTAS
ncbi:MAG: AI-2E family transporter [Actinobacteria bacterium]|nr:AI-2E family transporter [Actinomycetota bacterium]